MLSKVKSTSSISIFLTSGTNSSLVIFNLYSLIVPSSAVTLIVILFNPSFKVIFFSYSTVALLSLATASITILFISFLQVKLYSKIFALKPTSILSIFKDFKVASLFL